MLPTDMHITQQSENDRLNGRKLHEKDSLHEDDVEDIEKAFILPMSKTLKSSVFDLTSVYSSSMKHGGVAPLRISILVHYNVTPTTPSEPSNVYSN